MSFLQSGITLKALLEDPSLLAAPKQDGDKEKKSNDKTSDDLFSGSSAFLGPTLWDKSETLPYTDFQLEYMDLDEFLTENGIEDQLDAAATSGTIKKPVSPQSTPPASPSRESSPASLPISPMILQKPQSPTREPQPAPAASPARSEDGEVQVDYVLPSSDAILASIPETQTVSLRSPVSSEHGEREDFSNSDIILSTIPGQEMFDPRKKRFTDDELRPQPMIKKSRKVFVPEDCKDDKYWARRKKNNMAAKRSRDARRVKENQIAMRASFLERENNILKEELAKFKKENKELKQKLVDLTGHS